MSEAHDCHAKLMRFAHGTEPYHAGMTTPEAAATRTLALELPETEWQALRALEPDAIAWLRALIHTRLNERAEPEFNQFDDY
jgi:hypothetical protein